MNYHYRCIDCGTEYDSSELRYRCPSCAGMTADLDFQRGNLDVIYDREDLMRTASDPGSTQFDFFPFPIPSYASYPVGNTPLIRSGRISGRYGLPRLSFKNDGMNPSGSFKDRASQLIAAQALAYGENRVVVASTGNAGSAMACAGAAYGLDVILFVPESAPVNKLLQSVLYGTCVVPVKGTYDEAFSLSIAYTDAFGGINRNTAYNPMTVEGKKSVSIELYRQYGNCVPDIVYVPTGDGVILSGVYKGFSDLKLAGLTDRIPHLVAVQAEGSAAIAESFFSGHERALSEASTVADSISVNSPAAGTMAVRALAESGGWAVTVSDREILTAQRELSSSGGIFVEPAAAAAWAGVLKDAGMIKERFTADAEICVLLTGTGFKDMSVFSGSVSVPHAIQPELAQAEKLIARFHAER